MKCPHCHLEILRQTSIVIEYKGEKISLRELSRRCGIAYSTLRDRYENGHRGEQLTGAIDMRRTSKKVKRERQQLPPISEVSGLLNQFMSGGAR